MMPLKDITGLKVGMLTVICRHEKQKWVCKCDCGTEVIYSKAFFRTKTKIPHNCGCRRGEGRINDLTGKTFGQLTVLRLDIKRDKGARWICECVCGNVTSVKSDNLQGGHTRTCGCMTGLPHRLPPGSNKLFWIHHCMMQRCYNPKVESYKNYGGRGIEVHDKWWDFRTFFADIKDIYVEGLTIDRIDNEKGYIPGNVRWVDRTTNNRNSRWPKINIEIAKEIRRAVGSRTQIAAAFNVHETTVRNIKKNKIWKE